MLRGSGRDHAYTGVRRAPEHFTFTFTQTRVPNASRGSLTVNANKILQLEFAPSMTRIAGIVQKQWFTDLLLQLHNR